MKRFAEVILLAGLLLLTGTTHRAEPAAPSADERVWFVPVHVYVDPQGKALACYQVTVVASKNATLVGVEGGDSLVFSRAPYYDPRAMRSSRTIIGGYGLAGEFPTEKTRVATLMYRITGAQFPSYEATLTVAGTTDASAIPATVSLQPITWSRSASLTGSVALGGAR